MSLEEYESIMETAYIMSQPDLIEAIRQGDEDVKNGNYEVVNVDELIWWKRCIFALKEEAAQADSTGKIGQRTTVLLHGRPFIMN